MTRRKKVKIVIYFLLFGLILGGATFLAYNILYPQKTGVFPFFNKKATPKPNTVANQLDGTQSDPLLANRHPLAVIIENHPEARPQVGLKDASLVYEAITEGGITRFMAVYGPKEVAKIGPVRSVRTFFLDWAAEFNAYLAHVGGNMDALDRIPQEKVLDLDQFAVGTKAYWREPKAGIAIEHTMFTDTAKLYDVAKTKGYTTANSFTALKFFKEKEFKAKTDVKQTINIDFSSPSYKVSYSYDPTTKTYLRSMAGSPHKDRNTGNQLAPTNIIIQSVTRHNGLTRINEDTWTFDTISEGKAIVLYGGQKIEGTWSKKNLQSRTLFFDSTGEELKFLPGQFWYEIVPPEVFDKISINTETIASPSPSPTSNL